MGRKNALVDNQYAAESILYSTPDRLPSAIAHTVSHVRAING